MCQIYRIRYVCGHEVECEARRYKYYQKLLVAAAAYIHKKLDDKATSRFITRTLDEKAQACHCNKPPLYKQAENEYLCGQCEESAIKQHVVRKWAKRAGETEVSPEEKELAERIRPSFDSLAVGTSEVLFSPGGTVSTSCERPRPSSRTRATGTAKTSPRSLTAEKNQTSTKQVSRSHVGRATGSPIPRKPLSPSGTAADNVTPAIAHLNNLRSARAQNHPRPANTPTSFPRPRPRVESEPLRQPSRARSPPLPPPTKTRPSGTRSFVHPPGHETPPPCLPRRTGAIRRPDGPPERLRKKIQERAAQEASRNATSALDPLEWPTKVNEVKSSRPTVVRPAPAQRTSSLKATLVQSPRNSQPAGRPPTCPLPPLPTGAKWRRSSPGPPPTRPLPPAPTQRRAVSAPAKPPSPGSTRPVAKTARRPASASMPLPTHPLPSPDTGQRQSTCRPTPRSLPPNPAPESVRELRTSTQAPPPGSKGSLPRHLTMAQVPSVSGRTRPSPLTGPADQEPRREQQRTSVPDPRFTSPIRAAPRDARLRAEQLQKAQREKHRPMSDQPKPTPPAAKLKKRVASAPLPSYPSSSTRNSRKVSFSENPAAWLKTLGGLRGEHTLRPKASDASFACVDARQIERGDDQC